MNLYIQIKDGKPFEHPILEDNFKQAFPHIDVDNLPSEFAKFVRLQPPLLGRYETFDNPSVTYELVNGVYTDVFHTRPMTQEERDIVQKPFKDIWFALPNRENFSAWVFDEELCQYLPPIPRPDDGNDYFWQGATTSWVTRPQKPNDGKDYFWQITTLTWVEKPQKPDDGKVYKLDFASATWVEVPQV